MIDKNQLYLKPVATDRGGLSSLFRMLDIDFPAMARIPLFMLRASLKKERLKGVYLAGNGRNYGYAIFQRHTGQNLTHILYLAILPGHRSSGLGGVMLEKLDEMAGGRMLLDAEDPERAKNTKDRETAMKRIRFYRRNGFQVCPDFKFENVGYHLRVLSNCPFPKLDWLKFYRRLYNNAYGFPVAAVLIKAYG